MNNQIGLFDRPLLVDPPPRTHRDDPATSHRAEEVARAKFMRGHARAVLEFVRRHPGQTASEITTTIAAPAGSGTGEFAADDHRRLYQVRRRLSDLRGAGLVDRRILRGASEAAWFPTICVSSILTMGDLDV